MGGCRFKKYKWRWRIWKWERKLDDDKNREVVMGERMESWEGRYYERNFEWKIRLKYGGGLLWGRKIEK